MRAIVAVVALLALAAGASAQIAGCQFDSGTAQYDLSAGHTPTFYTQATAVYNYDLNICGNVNGVANCPGMACQYNKNQLVAVLATWPATAPNWEMLNESNPDAGVKFVLQNGSPCDYEGVQLPRVSIFEFLCIPSGANFNGMNVVGNVVNLTTCQAVYKIQTSAACPQGYVNTQGGGGHGLSGGWVFIILLIVFSVLYCGVGAFLQHRKGATGADLCPNREFWRSFPGLVKDGCLFTKDKVQGLRGGGGGGYQQSA